MLLDPEHAAGLQHGVHLLEREVGVGLVAHRPVVDVAEGEDDVGAAVGDAGGRRVADREGHLAGAAVEGLVLFGEAS